MLKTAICSDSQLLMLPLGYLTPYNNLSLSNLETANGTSKPTLIKWINRFLKGLSDWRKDSHRTERPNACFNAI